VFGLSQGPAISRRYALLIIKQDEVGEFKVGTNEAEALQTMQHINLTVKD
jgi:hypothetical protein